MSLRDWYNNYKEEHGIESSENVSSPSAVRPYDEGQTYTEQTSEPLTGTGPMSDWYANYKANNNFSTNKQNTGNQLSAVERYNNYVDRKNKEYARKQQANQRTINMFQTWADSVNNVARNGADANTYSMLRNHAQTLGNYLKNYGDDFDTQTKRALENALNGGNRILNEPFKYSEKSLSGAKNLLNDTAKLNTSNRRSPNYIDVSDLNTQAKTNDYYLQKYTSGENTENLPTQFAKRAKLATSPKPDTYSKDNYVDYLDRIEALADMDTWSDAQKTEARQIRNAINSRDGLEGNLILKLRNKEIDLPTYNRIVEASNRIGYKLSPAGGSAVTGFGQGSGAESLANLAMSGLNAITRDERGEGIADRSRAKLNELGFSSADTLGQWNEVKGYTQKEAPAAAFGGELAGTIALGQMMGGAVGAAGSGVARGLNALGVGARAAGLAGSAVAGAANFGSISAVQGAGDVARALDSNAKLSAQYDQGIIDEDQYKSGIIEKPVENYLKNIGISSAAGAAGNVAQSLTSLGFAKYLVKNRDTAGKFTEFMATVAPKAAFAVGKNSASFGIRAASGEQINAEEVARSLAMDFAYSLITGAIEHVNMTENDYHEIAQTMQELERDMEILSEQNYQYSNESEKAQLTQDIVNQINSRLDAVSAKINGRYYMGQSSYIDTLNENIGMMREVLFNWANSNAGASNTSAENFSSYTGTADTSSNVGTALATVGGAGESSGRTNAPTGVTAPDTSSAIVAAEAVTENMPSSETRTQLENIAQEMYDPLAEETIAAQEAYLLTPRSNAEIEADAEYVLTELQGMYEAGETAGAEAISRAYTDEVAMTVPGETYMDTMRQYYLAGTEGTAIGDVAADNVPGITEDMKRYAYIAGQTDAQNRPSAAPAAQIEATSVPEISSQAVSRNANMAESGTQNGALKTFDINRTSEDIVRDAQLVQELSDQLRSYGDIAGANVISRMYTPEAAKTIPASVYRSVMTKYYEAGQTDMDYEDFSATNPRYSEYLTEPMKQAAFNAGEADQLRRLESLAMGGEYGNQIYDGNEGRISSMAAGEQAGRLAEVAGKESGPQLRRSQAMEIRAAVTSSGQKAVTSRQLGFDNGSDNDAVYVVPKQMYSPEMNEINDFARTSGRNMHFIVGPISIVKNGIAAKARGAITDSDIYIRADHETLSPKQIALHELFHLYESRDPQLVKKLIEHIRKTYRNDGLKKLVEKAYEIYGGVYSPEEAFSETLADAYAGINVLEFKGEDGATAYTDVVRDYITKKGYEDSLSERGPPEAVKLEGDTSDAQFSLEFNDDIIERQEKAYDKYQDKLEFKEDTLTDAFDATRTMVDIMSPHKDILPADKVGKVLVKNGSYDYSVENTTICPRTLAYNSFVDMVQDMVGRPLTQMESFLVSQKMYDIAKDPQCLYCYVSLDRKAYTEMLNRYVDDRDAAIKAYEKAGKPAIPKNFINDDSAHPKFKLFDQFLNGRKNTAPMRVRYKDWIDAYNNGVKLLGKYDLRTEALRAGIAQNGSATDKAQLKDILKYAQSASWSKKQMDYVAYNGDILKLSPAIVKKLNDHYGLRFYSFSDYSGAFIVENMQQIIDASLRGLKGLGYTKETDFVEIFAPTGMNINISVFAKRNENGEFGIDPLQSADIEKAIELRNKFPNVGIVVTATDREGVEWALAQEWSDVVIPFHIVRTGADVASFYGWNFFNAEQADSVRDQAAWDAYIKELGVKNPKKVSKDIYPSEHNNDFKTYMRLIRQRGLKPRFESFIKNPNYMKLVNESRMAAKDTPAMQPKFDLDAAKRSFGKFIEKGGYFEGWYNEGVDVAAEVQTVANDVLAGKKANEVDYGRQDLDVEALKKSRKTNRQHGQFSLDVPSSQTDKEYMRAVNSGDIETARHMVEQRATEMGFENAIPEQTLSYKVRTGKAPQKTKKVYKVFTVDNQGRPSALFVSGVDPLPQNVWLDAQDTWHFKNTRNGKFYVPSTKNPNTQGGKTGATIPRAEISDSDWRELVSRGFVKQNSKSVTALAYRPGWHAGDLPFFPQGGTKVEGSNYENIHRYNQVVFECEMAYDKDYTNTYATKDGKTAFRDMQEMPLNGGYEFATNPMTQAEDLGKWFISSSLKIGRALSEAECNEVLKENGMAPQEWQASEYKNGKLVGIDKTIGSLNLENLGYTGEQYDAARKTLAPVTYDDNGNVIPLSERFNVKKNDIRYSLDLPSGKTDKGDDIDYWLESLSIDDIMDSLRENSSKADTNQTKQRAQRRVDQVNERLKTIGLQFNGTSEAAWLDETIEDNLKRFAASNPNYAQAYITYISPQDFLKLTVGTKTTTLDMIENETAGYGELDINKLKDGPMYLDLYGNVKDKSARVVGHEGRHRMMLLGRAGFSKVPILVFDSSDKYGKTTLTDYTLKPQRFYDRDSLISSARNVKFDELIPFSEGNRDLIKQKFGSGNKNASVRYSLDTSNGFYSQLEDTLEGYKGDKIGTNSVVSYLKGKGVKDEEIKWTGIQTFLEGKKSVSKEELLQYVRDNQIEITEKVLSQDNESDVYTNEYGDEINVSYYYNDSDEGPAYFANEDEFKQYVEELADENGYDINDIEYDIDEYYGHMMAMVDGETIVEAHIPDAYDLTDAGFSQDPTHWSEYALKGGENYREILFQIPGNDYSNSAMETHWGGETGVLAHARVQDFDTNDGKVLFVEEIQSDWHNAGQKYGYGENNAKVKTQKYLSERKNAVREALLKAFEQKDVDMFLSDKREQVAAIPHDKYFAMLDVEDKAEMKWNAHNTEKFETIAKASTKAEDVPDAPFGNSYTNFVLKSLLRMAAEGDYDYLAWTTADMQSERWSDQFAEGYRIEYDQDIPKFLKKYGKQWGAGLTTVDINEGEYTVPAIVVNNEMKSSILTKGQPRFSVEEDLEAAKKENTRLSKKVNAQLKKNEALQQQNDELQAEVNRLATALTNATAKPVKGKDFSQNVKDIIKSYSSQADVENITAELAKAADRFGNDPQNAWAYLKDVSVKSANEIINNAKVMAEYGDAYEVKRYLRKRSIPVSETMKKDIPDYEKLRRSHWGTLNLSTKAPGNFEELYKELREQFGAEMFPAEIQNPTDMLLKLLDVVDDAQAIFENPYDQYRAEAVEYLSNELVSLVVEAKSPDKSPKYKKKYEDMRAQNKEAVVKSLEEVVKERDRQLKALKQRYEKQEAVRRERRETHDKRMRLLKVARRIEKMRNKTTRANQAWIDETLGELDTIAISITGRTIKKLSDMKVLYDSLVNDPDNNFEPDERIEKKLLRLSQPRVEGMNLEEVEDLTEALMYIEHEIRTKNQLIEERDAKEKYHEGSLSIRDINNASAGKVPGLVVDTLRPDTFMQRLVGFNPDSPLYKRFRAIDDGYTKKIDYQRRAYSKYFDRFLQDKDLVKDMREREIDIAGVKSWESMDAVSTKISPDLLMSLYMASFNESNMRHIRAGGVEVPDIKLYKAGKTTKAAEKSTKIYLNKKDIQQLAEKELTPKELALCKSAQAYYSEMSAPEINDVSELLKGYPIAKVKFYWRIHTSKAWRRTDLDTVNYNGSIAGQGWTNERIESSVPVVLQGFAEQIKADIENHSDYVGLALPIRNFNKVYGITTHSYDSSGKVIDKYKDSVQHAIITKFGQNADDYIQKLIKDIQRPINEADTTSKFLNKARSNYAANALTLNLSVGIKQAASYPTAAAVLGWGPLIKALATFPATKGKSSDWISQYNPLMDVRTKGYTNVDFGDIKNNGNKISQFLAKPSLNLIQKIDVGTLRLLWLASEYYVRDNFPQLKVGTDEYYQKVGEIHRQVTEETQPNYTPLQRPQILRSNNDLTKLLNMFKTQPYQNLNILYEAAANLAAQSKAYKNAPNDDTIKERYKEAWKKMGRAVTSQLVSSLVFALMQFAWDWFRKKDDKYKDKETGEYTLGSWGKRIGINMLTNGFGMVPYASVILEWGETLYDKIIKAAGKEKFFDSTFYGYELGAATDNINNLGSGIMDFLVSMYKIVNNQENSKDFIRNVVSVGTDVSAFFGIPAGNVEKTAVALAKQIFPHVMGKYEGEYYALDITDYVDENAKDEFYTVLKKAMQNDPEQYKAIYEAMIENDKFQTASNSPQANINAAMRKWYKQQIQDTYEDDKAEYDRLNKELHQHPELFEDVKNDVEYYIKEWTKDFTKAEEEEQAQTARKAVGITETMYSQYEAALAKHDYDNSGRNSQEEVYWTLVDLALSKKQTDQLWKEKYKTEFDKYKPKTDHGGEKSNAQTKTEPETEKQNDEGYVSISNSSLIAGLNYHAADQVLEVTLNSGATYTYSGISKDTYEAFKAADSKGSFYNNYIK